MTYNEQLDKDALNIYLLKPYIQEGDCCRYGFSFDEVLEVFPEILIRNKKTGVPININYNDLSVLLLHECKRHNETISNQRESIKNLKDRMRIIEEQIAMILTKMAKE